ncbi:MAG: YkgJ family cysteine cluster protein [Candidatus Omnitrophota bacterium]|nr:YkgJ family cysteine cluster protein [Candidatus Omnitrophota bacterium]
MIKQLIPEGYCLKCQGCCRFREEFSAWLPCLLEEEVQDLLGRQDIPAASLSADKRIHPIPGPDNNGFLCPFLGLAENKCGIYRLRPFECQLYPFLLNLRRNKVFLTVDLNCPYAREHLHSPGFIEYTAWLVSFLNTPQQLKVLRDNPQLLQAYEEVAEIIELKALDENK